MIQQTKLLVGPILFPELPKEEFIKGLTYQFRAHFFPIDYRGSDMRSVLGHRVFEIILREVPCVTAARLDVGEFSQPVLDIRCGPLYRNTAPEYLAGIMASKLARHYGKREVSVIGTTLDLLI